MSHQCSWEREGFIVRYRGTVRSFEVPESKRYFYKSERSDYAKYQIVDFSQAHAGELLDVDFELACAMDLGASTYLRHHLVAFVVSNLEIFTQTLNYIERAKAAGCTWSFRIFTRLDDARSWIMLELGHH